MAVSLSIDLTRLADTVATGPCVSGRTAFSPGPRSPRASRVRQAWAQNSPRSAVSGARSHRTYVSPYTALPWAQEKTYTLIVGKLESKRALFAEQEGLFGEIVASPTRGAAPPGGAKVQILKTSLEQSPYRKISAPQKSTQRYSISPRAPRLMRLQHATNQAVWSLSPPRGRHTNRRRSSSGSVEHTEPIRLHSQGGEEQLFQTLCASPKDRHGQSLAWCGSEPPRNPQTAQAKAPPSPHAHRLNQSTWLHSVRHGYSSNTLSAVPVDDTRDADPADELASWLAALGDEQMRGEPGRTSSLPSLPARSASLRAYTGRVELVQEIDAKETVALIPGKTRIQALLPPLPLAPCTSLASRSLESVLDTNTPTRRGRKTNNAKTSNNVTAKTKTKKADRPIEPAMFGLYSARPRELPEKKKEHRGPVASASLDSLRTLSKCSIRGNASNMPSHHSPMVCVRVCVCVCVCERV